MPIDSVHPQYKAHQSEWELCRDLKEGERAVKFKGEKYLPAPSGFKQTWSDDADYESYKTRASLYTAFSRTVMALSGVVFSKPPKLSTKLSIPLDNIDGSRATYASFHKILVEELLTVPRLGLLSDWDDNENRPVIKIFHTENIINWSYADNGNLEYVILKLPYVDQVEPDDKYEMEENFQYTELYLDGEGYYKMETWREKKDDNDKTKWVLHESRGPNVKGDLFAEIPFLFVNVKAIGPDIHPPVLDGLANVNIGHYRNSADLEHALHLTALPTPYVIGMTKRQGERPLIGSSTAWMIPNSEAKVGMLEFSGAGCKAMAENMATKEGYMAVLGARALESPKKAVESHESLRSRRSAENSALSMLAESTVQAMKWVVNQINIWNGNEEVEIDYEMDLQFSTSDMKAGELVDLFKVYQSGGMSIETFLWNANRGGFMPDGANLDDEAEILSALGTNMPIEETDNEQSDEIPSTGSDGQ